MSIPGLGQIPVQANTSSPSRTVALSPAWEWRFQSPPSSSLSVTLLTGTAEKDGIELAPRHAYAFPPGTASKILTWHGCELSITGRCDDSSVAEYDTPAANPATSHVNLHARLAEMRKLARREGRAGPRVMVVGPGASGKSTLARTLASYATRQGAQVVAVNADPGEGMLSLPGTLTASVLATVLDAEAGDGWGGTATSGASGVPVKLPVVFGFGRERPEEDEGLYRALVARLAGAVSGRLSDDEEVRSSGVIVDSMAVSCDEGRLGIDLLAHIADELSVNVVVVMGSARLHAELTRRFAGERTNLGEVIQVVPLDRSEGVVERDETRMRYAREAAVKEYFFGDARRTLSPQIQQVDFDAVLIYRDMDGNLVKEEPSSLMQHWTLAVMHASLRDPPETVRVANVMGFVYVADVDEERNKVKILAPVGGRLGDKPMVLGRWPEPYINLLG